MKNEKKFKQLINEAWEALKSAYHPKYHAKLRNTLLKIIAAEDTEFTDFVELMKVSGYDVVFQNAAGYDNYMKDKEKIDKVNKELQEVWDKTKPASRTDPAKIPIKCEYCGETHPLADMSGSKKGLVCYKCRHELENRD